jgi:hypothetical protein
LPKQWNLAETQIATNAFLCENKEIECTFPLSFIEELQLIINIALGGVESFLSFPGSSFLDSIEGNPPEKNK